MIREVKNIKEVSVFFQALLQEGVNAHPDEDFHYYINHQTEKPTYSDAEAILRNDLMSASFEVCQTAGIDIYDLMQEIYLKETGMDQFIPLPSEEKFDEN
jgi:hypothetical protein